MKNQTKLSWTPVLRGKIFCAAACGFGCTKVAHDEAQRAAVALCKHLGPKWEPHVWENFGWHYAVTCGYWYVTGGPNRYTAFLNSNPDNLPGGEWAENGRTPEEAMRSTWKAAKARLQRYSTLLTSGAPSNFLAKEHP